ncbi:MAG TPA: hypothetical protein VIH13_05700 [Candidatus Hydromicrobium sp.]
MFKKMLVFILIVTLIFIISGCKSEDERAKKITSEIPSEGLYVRCIELEEKIPYNVIDDVEFPYFDENTLFENSNLIFKGTVINEVEIGIEEYIDGKLERTYYEDVSTFEIEKIYYSEDLSLEIGDVVKVGNTSCSYWWVEGTLKMEKDKEYIVLVKKKSDTSNVEFTEYYDYFVENYWVPIIRVENGNYFVDEMLTSLISGAKEEVIREDGDFKTTVYVKGEEFENELENLITEIKNGD